MSTIGALRADQIRALDGYRQKGGISRAKAARRTVASFWSPQPGRNTAFAKPPAFGRDKALRAAYPVASVRRLRPEWQWPPVVARVVLGGVPIPAIRILALLALLWAGPAPIVAAAGLPSGRQALPGPLPAALAQDAELGGAIDLSREQFFIAPPANHAASMPFGVLVFMSPADECLAVPPGWASVLQERRLVFIAPQNAGNKQPTLRRAALAIAAAGKLAEITKIDPNRIFAAGFSGGARIASYASFLSPSPFSGVFGVCGAEFPATVPRVKATRPDEYGAFSIGQERIAAAKKRVRFVLVTGAKDFRYGNILDIYAGGFQKEGYAAKLIDVPGMDHAICSPKALAEGLAFLDQAR